MGDFIVGTVTRRIENIYNAVQKAMRKWSNDFVVRRLLDFLVILNPRLNPRQRVRLKSILHNVVDQLVWQRSLDPRVMRDIVALACPNQDTGLLFAYLMEVITALAYNSYEGKERTRCSSDVESPTSDSVQKCEEDAKIAQELHRTFCVEQVYVAAMPATARKAVLGALHGGVEFPSQRQGSLSPPICCITLEPLLLQDGTVTSDVVAVVQRSYTIGKQHAFLYRGRALFDWLGHSQIPRNPETRSLVRPTDIFRLS